jgi:hypothetical protein
VRDAVHVSFQVQLPLTADCLLFRCPNRTAVAVPSGVGYRQACGSCGHRRRLSVVVIAGGRPSQCGYVSVR